MPGLTHRNCQFTNDNAVCANGFWSKHRDEITFNHLQKFWSELSPQARQQLLKIDKQTILEQARKNMYCSRCNGLLLDGFMQIVMYGKSSQPDGIGGLLFGRRYAGLKNQSDVVSNSANGCYDDSQDPAAHPWGGLTTAKDGTLTVLSTYIYSKSLRGLQNVFDSARARERERELLYPDACGGGGRGWISQGIPSYGRGHGTRETCSLHTARLSCDTLVDFWSALGEETRNSLLRMKEEDFIERLMYRFDSKRFCRDCRKNVIREFKELKELKRLRKEQRCTHTFCAADSIFQYEVSDGAIQADWRQTFMDSAGIYHYFEWAVGTGEGKSDILEFENVGMNKLVKIDGLDLGGLSTCYITLRAWKQDGRCTELSVKAHALKGQECVHSRLVLGDGFVSITRGESIRKLFEHAEEAEEEEDDDIMDKDGNELDGECSRPQKHAKSPELAREFLLDAATVIFKEQVEKAFREGTARQNAHSIFICLVLKLLEERVHVACKEIITLVKQTKLLEEEEKEKREEEERKERRRMKEREKKQRRKERLKEKDRYKDKEVSSSISVPVQHREIKDEQSNMDDEEIIIANGTESSSELTTGRPPSPNVQNDILEISSDWYSSLESQDHNHGVVADSGDSAFTRDECDYTTSEHSQYSFYGDKFQKDENADSVSKCSERRRSGHVSGNAHVFSKLESRVHINNIEACPRMAKGLSRQYRANGAKAQPRNCAIKHGSEKFHSPNIKMGERNDNSCSCNYISDSRVYGGSKVPTARSGWETNDDLKSDLTSDRVNHFHNGAKNCQSDHLHDSNGRSHIKNTFGSNRSRDLLHTKMVWEPMDSHKKYPRRNSESDIAMISSSLNIEGSDSLHVQLPPITNCCGEDAWAHTKIPSGENSSVCPLNKDSKSYNSIDSKMRNSNHSEGLLVKEVDFTQKVLSLNNSCDAIVGCDSNSENSYSNLSEGDSNLTSSNTQNLETTNSSDSEDCSQESENKEASLCQRSEIHGCEELGMAKTLILKSTESCKSDIPSSIQFEIGRFNHLINSTTKSTMNLKHIASSFLISESQDGSPPPPNQSLPFPVYHQAPLTMGYYQPSTVIWPTPPANGLLAMPQLNPYVVSSPLNYGWNGHPGFCMPFSGVSHLEPPLLGEGYVSIYHPASKVSGMQQEQHIKISKPILAKEVSFQGRNKVHVVPASVCLEDAPNGRTVPKPDPPKAHIGKENNNAFSLFHFGGPAALSATLKEGKIEEFLLNNSLAHPEVDHVCSKKEETVEEYSLFAATNGFKFSF